MWPMKRKAEPLTPEELAILHREDAEAAHSAMPDEIQGNTFGSGRFMNNVSRIQLTGGEKAE